jgi:hypothetical protein
MEVSSSHAVPPSPSAAPPDTDDWYLEQAVAWQKIEKQKRKRKAFTEPEPEPAWVDDVETVEHQTWEWNKRLHETGFITDAVVDPAPDLRYIKTTLERNGLDVVLRVPVLPDSDDTFIAHGRNDPNNILLQIVLEPGPLFLEQCMISDFAPPVPYHVSLIFTYEVGDYLWRQSSDKPEFWSRIRMFRALYGRLRDRYHNRQARLMGRVTNGLSLELSRQTQVDGIHSNILDDPDIIAIRSMPGAYTRRALHVSM